MAMDACGIATLVNYLCDRKSPNGMGENDKRKVRQMAVHFTIVDFLAVDFPISRDRIMFHVDPETSEKTRVPTKEEIPGILEATHSSRMGGGHFGMNKTFHKVRPTKI